MNWESFIQTVLTAAIPSFFTYMATKKSNESKIKEITISKDSEIQQLKLQHQHEIDKLESEHQHNIDKLKLEHQFLKESKSSDMTTKMVEKFLTGELDVDAINSSIPKLTKLQKDIKRLSNKKNTSDFIKRNNR